MELGRDHGLEVVEHHMGKLFDIPEQGRDVPAEEILHAGIRVADEFILQHIRAI